MKTIWQWCRENRHQSLKEQYGDLVSKLLGYYQYYSISCNYKALKTVFEHTQYAWRYWLSRRSHKGNINIEKFTKSILSEYSLPKPRIVHKFQHNLQDSKVTCQTGRCLSGQILAQSFYLLRNRMREIFTYGSVGRAISNYCLYLEDQPNSRWGDSLGDSAQALSLSNLFLLLLIYFVVIDLVTALIM